MGFGDWLSRTFGGSEPEPAPLPKPPGEPEILASLEHVDRLLADSGASPLVRSRVTRIGRTIREILPRLATLGVGSQDAYAVVATATNYRNRWRPTCACRATGRTHAPSTAAGPP